MGFYIDPVRLSVKLFLRARGLPRMRGGSGTEVSGLGEIAAGRMGAGSAFGGWGLQMPRMLRAGNQMTTMRA